MKLKELVAGEAALGLLADNKFDDVQKAWDLADAIELVEKAIKRFQEKRVDYIKANGVPVEGTEGSFKMEDQIKFQEHITKLLDVDVRVKFPKLTKIDLKGISASPSDIAVWKSLGLLESEKRKTNQKKQQ